MELESRRPPRAPGELIFRNCYAPADLRAELAAENAGERIAALPAVQVFYGMQELDEAETQALIRLLPGEKWRELLDLSLWKRDRADLDRFLAWQSSALAAGEGAARRLLDAPDAELYELAFKRHLRIYARLEEDEFEPMPPETRAWFDTPDKGYRIALPRDPERARLLRELVLALYRVEPKRARIILESLRARTATEMEETAYQESKRRLEEQGFQDYFDALEAYAPLEASSRLPEKRPAAREAAPSLPARLPGAGASPWLLMRALSLLSDSEDASPLVQEISFVCNKVLSADGVSPADAARVRQGIRKTVSGINLGLDCWAGGDAGRAVEGIRRHYLQSFFQVACGELAALARRVRRKAEERPVEPGSLEEAALEGLDRRMPLFTVQIRGRIRRRYFFRRRDLDKIEALF